MLYRVTREVDMKSRWHLIAVVVLLAISAVLLMGSVAPSSHATGNVHSLKVELKQAGFFVPKEDSALASFDMPTEVCCPVDAKFKCMYNNVNAPYLVSKVLPGPGEADVLMPNNNFHLGQNEALILVGQTPPPMAYFSYTVFMGSRRTTRFPYNFPELAPVEKRVFSLVNDYVADSINNMTINTGDPSQGPFNRPMLLFIVADQEVEARVRAAAEAAGYSPSTFNTIVLPPALLHLGVDEKADTFFLVQRTAVPDQQAALDEYLAHPQTMLRVTLKDKDWQPKPIPVPKVAVRGTGQTELDLLPAVDALGEAIKTRYPHAVATEQKLDWFYWEGFTGLQEEVNEMAPSSDAAGPRTDKQFFLPNTPGSFAMVYGVNHHATGKTSYSSFSLYEDTLWLGLDSVFDWQYAGTATDYLPANTPDIDKLYAWKIAWDCGDDAHCMTIKQPDCARLTLTDESPYKIIFRLYLEPATKTGPEIREVLFDRVMVFTPKP
jgi:hypothetical protein